MRNKIGIAKRRLTYVFSFYSQSTASEHLRDFKEFLKSNKVRHADDFIIHDIRKIVLNEIRQVHGDEEAKRFSHHSSLSTTYKYYI